MPCADASPWSERCPWRPCCSSAARHANGRDRRKWHTEQGPLSVSGPKFMNWQRGQGGGGAIDLVMHLAGISFGEAVAWLERHMVAIHGGEPATSAPEECTAAKNLDVLRLPAPDECMLGSVRCYLTGCRGLAVSLIEPLIQRRFPQGEID